MSKIFTLNVVSRGFEDLIGNYSSKAKAIEAAKEHAKDHYVNYPKVICKDYTFRVYSTKINETKVKLVDEFTYEECYIKTLI